MKKIYLFTPTHLPRNGWLQGCVRCNMITGGCKRISKHRLPFYLIMHRRLFNKIIYAYICKNCVKNKKLTYNYINSSLNDYIEN